MHLLLTNPQPHGERLAQLLAAHHCRVTQLPLWEVAAPSDGAVALRRACAALSRYHWIAFSSQFAVEAVVHCVAGMGLDWPKGTPRIAAVGSATAETLRGEGMTVDCVSMTANAAGLVTALAAVDLAGARILLPQARTARPELAEGLARAGATVEIVEAYMASPRVIDARRWLADRQRTHFDAVIFTAPSAVEQFLILFGEVLNTAPFAGTTWYAIGPTTARTMERGGLAPVQTPAQPTFTGLAGLFQVS